MKPLLKLSVLDRLSSRELGALLPYFQDCKEHFQFLLDIGADINYQDKYGTTILHLAARDGRLELVQFLISNGADILYNNANSTALHRAAEYGHLDVVKYLVDIGVDIHMKDDHGWTALDMAILWAQWDVVTYLESLTT